MQSPATAQYALFLPKFGGEGFAAVSRAVSPKTTTGAPPPGSAILPFTGVNLAIVLTVAVLLVAAAVLLRVRVRGLGR